MKAIGKAKVIKSNEVQCSCNGNEIPSSAAMSSKTRENEEERRAQRERNYETVEARKIFRVNLIYKCG